MEINGMAHVILTAGDYRKSTAFYRKLLPFLGMTIVLDSDDMLYGVGGRTALGVRPPAPEHDGARFVQSRAGLHHLCFRAREREDVDALHEFLLKERTKIVHPPEDGPWAPGYYSILFEDPDGVRLEMNHVPGKGLFDTGGKLKEI
ncbi:MAG: VOC family protein [Parvularculaceae bacterium]